MLQNFHCELIFVDKVLETRICIENIMQIHLILWINVQREISSTDSEHFAQQCRGFWMIFLIQYNKIVQKLSYRFPSAFVDEQISLTSLEPRCASALATDIWTFFINGTLLALSCISWTATCIKRLPIFSSSRPALRNCVSSRRLAKLFDSVDVLWTLWQAVNICQRWAKVRESGDR